MPGARGCGLREGRLGAESPDRPATEREIRAKRNRRRHHCFGGAYASRSAGMMHGGWSRPVSQGADSHGARSAIRAKGAGPLQGMLGAKSLGTQAGRRGREGKMARHTSGKLGRAALGAARRRAEKGWTGAAKAGHTEEQRGRSAKQRDTQKAQTRGPGQGKDRSQGRGRAAERPAPNTAAGATTENAKPQCG